MSQKIVINTTHGGFSLSGKANKLLKKLWPKASVFITAGNSYYYRGFRNNPALVEVVEKLGEEANGLYASLKVVEIPDGVKWEIQDYDGVEHIAEEHRTWY